MKQLQKGYNEIQALEVELRILERTSAPPSRPRKFILTVLFTIHWPIKISLKFLFLHSFSIQFEILLHEKTTTFFFLSSFYRSI